MSKYPKSQNVIERIKELGLLLESDPKLPSVATIIAGEPIRGSWWGHAKGQEIFGVVQDVAGHQDVLITKLLSGKVTFVHRKFWCDIVSIGQARENWQLAKLSTTAQAILEEVDRQGSLQTNEMEWQKKLPGKPGDAVRELEKYLLIQTEQFHTSTGDHAKRLQSWQQWAAATGLKCKPITPITIETAKRKLEKRVADWNEQFGAAAKLPWPVRK
ncbi:MAG TPA: hypothetical protein VN643_06815 [Pyrinomonadaceae bacterium]|nr:hypothetical protein [Pyrinomonadaceae bacterium]